MKYWALIYGAHFSKKDVEILKKKYGNKCKELKLFDKPNPMYIARFLNEMKYMDPIVIDKKLENDTRIVPHIQNRIVHFVKPFSSTSQDTKGLQWT